MAKKLLIPILSTFILIAISIAIYFIIPKSVNADLDLFLEVKDISLTVSQKQQFACKTNSNALVKIWLEENKIAKIESSGAASYILGISEGQTTLYVESSLNQKSLTKQVKVTVINFSNPPEENPVPEDPKEPSNPEDPPEIEVPEDNGMVSEEQLDFKIIPRQNVSYAENILQLTGNMGMFNYSIDSGYVLKEAKFYLLQEKTLQKITPTNHGQTVILTKQEGEGWEIVIQLTVEDTTKNTKLFTKSIQLKFS